MRISDWSSDVCSSDLREHVEVARFQRGPAALEEGPTGPQHHWCRQRELDPGRQLHRHKMMQCREQMTAHFKVKDGDGQHQSDPEATRHVDQFGTRPSVRSETHTSELQSLMRHSYAVFHWKNQTTLT